MEGAKAIPDPKAQAAELKKRLLRNKKLGNSTDISTTPRTSPGADTPAKSRSTPHSQPQVPIHADSADIDALIAAHSKPELPNANTSAAGHLPNNTNKMLPEEGEIAADERNAMHGRLGRYTITKGKMTTSPTSTASTTQHTAPSTANQATENLTGALAMKTATDLLSQLDDDDANDLHDWLTLTGFFDRQARKKKLERSRKLAQFEAEERRIKAEEARVKADQERLAAERRKLMEEDDDEVLPASVITQTPRPTSVICTTNPQDAQREPGKETMTKPADNQALLPPGPEDTPQKVKNGEQEGANARDKDTEIMDRDADIRASRRSSRSRHHDIEGYHGRSLSRRSASPPLRRGAPRYDNDGDGYGRNHEYDSYYGNASGGYRGRGNYRDAGWHRTPSPRRRAVADPKPIDLGGRGETRFFMVKSFTHENVRQCMEDGIWATQLQNAEVLSNAFAHCKNVILFFSVNKSRAFQGYARMVTAPSPDIPQPKWLSIIHWETTPPFRLEWLSTVEIPFLHVGHLKNRLNEGAAVLIGKDGQEIDEECGHRLVEVMEDIIRNKNEDREYYDQGGQRLPRAYRGRGGYRAGDRDGGRGGRFFKSEYDNSR